MSRMPLLGCLDEKIAGAYLMRPKTVPKRKKKKEKNEKIVKAASLIAEQAVLAEQRRFQRKLQSGGMDVGSNPFAQLLKHNR